MPSYQLKKNTYKKKKTKKDKKHEN